jgi:hypothetical protein
MKMRTFAVPVLVLCLVVVWSCVTTKSKSTIVVTDDRGIVIKATPFSQEDQDAMDAILAKYDKELYKVDTHKNGQFKKRHGTLVDVFTEKELAASIAENLKKQGFTRSAVRVGRYTASDRATGTNSPQPTPAGGTSSNPQRIQQEKLISELTPILDKYNNR